MIELVKPQQRTQSATGEWQPRLQDWHLPSIRATGTDDDDAHETDVLTSPPELQRPPLRHLHWRTIKGKCENAAIGIDLL